MSILIGALLLSLSAGFGEESLSGATAPLKPHSSKTDLGAVYLGAYLALYESMDAAEAGDWRSAQRDLAEGKALFRKLNAAIHAHNTTARIDPHGRRSRAFRKVEKLIESAKAIGGEQDVAPNPRPAGELKSE